MKKLIALMLCAVLILLIGCEAEINESVPESIVDSQDASGTAESSETSEVGDDSSAPDDTSAPTAIKDEYYEGYTGSKKELVLKLDYGMEDGQIAKDTQSPVGGHVRTCAEAFLVQDGYYHILNSFVDKISVFDESGNFIKGVSLGEYPEQHPTLFYKYEPMLLAYNEDEYAVFIRPRNSQIDQSTHKAIKCENYIMFIPENGKVELYSLKDLVDYESNLDIYNMEYIEGGLKLYAWNRELYLKKNSDAEGISVEEAKTPFVRCTYDEETGNKTITFGNDIEIILDDELSKKGSSNPYLIEDVIVNIEKYYFSLESVLTSETRISRYDDQGKLIDYAIVVPPEDEMPGYYQYKEFYVSSCGIYTMYFQEDGVYIYQVEMGNTAISPAQYLYHQLDE